MAHGTISQAIKLIQPNTTIKQSYTYYFATAIPSYQIGYTVFVLDLRGPRSTCSTSAHRADKAIREGLNSFDFWDSRDSCFVKHEGGGVSSASRWIGVEV